MSFIRKNDSGCDAKINAFQNNFSQPKDVGVWLELAGFDCVCVSEKHALHNRYMRRQDDSFENNKGLLPTESVCRNVQRRTQKGENKLSCQARRHPKRLPRQLKFEFSAKIRWRSWNGDRRN